MIGCKKKGLWCHKLLQAWTGVKPPPLNGTQLHHTVFLADEKLRMSPAATSVSILSRFLRQLKWSKAWPVDVTYHRQEWKRLTVWSGEDAVFTVTSRLLGPDVCILPSVWRLAPRSHSPSLSHICGAVSHASQPSSSSPCLPSPAARRFAVVLWPRHMTQRATERAARLQLACHSWAVHRSQEVFLFMFDPLTFSVAPTTGQHCHFNPPTGVFTADVMNINEWPICSRRPVEVPHLSSVSLSELYDQQMVLKICCWFPIKHQCLFNV